MSLLTMATVGIGRDKADAGDVISKDATAVLGPRTSSAATVGANSAAKSPADCASFGQLLVAQIPSEALLAYTTLLALFSVGNSSYKTGRWILYFAAIVVCAATVLSGYFAKRDYVFVDGPKPNATDPATPAAHTVAIGGPSALSRLHLPILPTSTAVLSMAVYGLTVPGSPLQAETTGATFGICSGCLAVGGGVMMSIFTPFLAKGNGAVTTGKPAASPAGPPPPPTATFVAASSPLPVSPSSPTGALPTI